jgi:glycerophosphoryl diester phosphodiesterase
MEARGAAADEVDRLGSAAPTYESERSDASLAALARSFDGISMAVGTVMAGVDTVAPDTAGRLASSIVDRAHAAGLVAYAWTLRPENRFLPGPLKRGGEVAAHGDWQRWYTSVMRTGLDGVFADHPDLAVAARSRLHP